MTPKPIFISGHRGLVGRALARLYEQRAEWRILTQTRQETDLTNPAAVDAYFENAKPEYVILAAARVGGIKASYTQPVEFLLENLQIQNNVIQAACKHGVQKLLFLGSTCIYPKAAEIPIKENSLLTGPMESTNDAYGIAKIAGLRLCQAYRTEYDCHFITAMPANLYGPHDNFDPEHSHVLPSLIRKFHDATTSKADHVTLWGTGSPRREFLFVDDLADACAFLMDHYDSGELVNVGPGQDISIREVAEMIREITGYKGEIIWDTTQPDGNPRRLLDIERIRSLGWQAAKTPLKEGLEKTYQWYLENQDIR